MTARPLVRIGLSEVPPDPGPRCHPPGADQDDGPRPDATGHTVCDVSTTEAGAGLRTVARVSRAQRPRAGVEKVLLRN